MSELSQVRRLGDLRIANACCLPMPLWSDVINKMANSRDCTRQVFISGFSRISLSNGTRWLKY